MIQHHKSQDNMVRLYSAVQSRKAITANFTNEKLLPFGFPEQYMYNIKLDETFIETSTMRC